MISHMAAQSGLVETDGGVVNPIGPVDSSMELDEEDLAETIAEDLPDHSADQDYSSPTRDESVTVSVQSASGVAGVHVLQSVCSGCQLGLQKFGRGVRLLWATRQTEDTKENRELVVKITLRELIIYLLFLVDLCIVSFGSNSSMAYYLTSAVTQIFINEPSNSLDSLTTYKDINSVDDWFSFATGPLLSGLYAKSMSSYTVNNTDVPCNSTMATKVLIENKLLGLPRLRLLRVRNNSCEINVDFRDLISECYNVYSSGSEDQSPFGPQSSPAWFYQTGEALQSSSYWGDLAIYGGGGYVQDLVGGYDAALATIVYLQNNNWIDRGARALFVDFSLYNPNVNLFCVVSLLCEFPATGGALTSWNVRTVKLLRYVNSMDYFVMACELLFSIFIIYYIVEEVLEISRNRWSYFMSFYNILDILIICTSICCISFYIYRLVTVDSSLLAKVHTSDKFVDMTTLTLSQISFNCTLAVTLFLVWVKMFKFISFNRTMNQLSLTMSSCFKDLASFTFMFLIVFFSFAQLGFLLFGAQIQSYSSFSLALFSQFRILLGDFEFQQLLHANRVLGPTYFIVYIFFTFFILMNMFLAIMNDAYAEMKADASRKQREFEIIDFFKKSYRKVLAKLKLRKREKSANKLGENDDDKADSRPVHYDRWRKERLREGYSEAQIVAVSGRHNTDSGRSIEKTELRKMQIELNQHKFADKEDSDSIDMSDEEDGSSMTKSGSRGRRADCHDNGGRGSGRGVTHEEFSMLQRRVDRMEHSIGSIVSKIDAVLVKLEVMEQTKAHRRETVGRLLDSIAESEGVTDESKRQHMERLVRDELERWDSESCISGPYEVPPASSNSGRSTGRARLEQSQDFYQGGNV